MVTLYGGLTTSLYLNPYDIGRKLASIFDGQCYYIHTPHITDSTLVELGYINRTEIEKLRQQGVVGSVWTVLQCKRQGNKL